MKQYTSKDILNVAIMGHGGSGKTSLVESMLFLSGMLSKMGNTYDGNTACDFDAEEIKRKSSISSSIAPLEWKNRKINFIDTPGSFDFESGVCEGLRAADSSLIVLSGKDGVLSGTEKVVQMSDEKKLPKVFFVNGLCDDESRFYRVFESLKASFGPAVCPVVVPFIKDSKVECYVNLLEYKAYSYEDSTQKEVPVPDMGTRWEGLRNAINEAVAETDEKLFEKYFSGEGFTPEEIILGISKGVKDGSIFPVFCGDALSTFGVEQLLNGLSWLLPSVFDRGSEIALDENDEPVEISLNEDNPTAAIVFKTTIDPFMGKLSYFKVISGKVSKDLPLINMSTKALERVGKIVSVCGKRQEDIQSVSAGDIGVLCKSPSLNTGDTLCSAERKVTLEGVDYPKPCLSMAISAKDKNEEDKLALCLTKICLEDPTITLRNDNETHEMILSGLGEQHLDVIVSKLKNKYSIEAVLKKPKVAYRETIRKSVSVQGRHKKQTGGHGQFGDVWIKFEPCESDGLEFCEEIVGGAVPKGYFPAVEKGLIESMQKGPLEGYPVVGLKATLYDGSYHPVDSSEMAFKMAASLAYRNGMPKADPVLLEPIGKLLVRVPDKNMGDVIGEITKRRGRIVSMEAAEPGWQKIEANAPVSEMQDFSTFVRRSTAGRGSMSFEFNHYEQLTNPTVLSKI